MDYESYQKIFFKKTKEKFKQEHPEVARYKIKVEDLVRQFYLWVIRDPEAAAQWPKGETERKKV